jgi:acetyl esterase/lipase
MIGTTGDQATVLDDPSLGNAGVSSAVHAVVDLFGPTDFLQADAQFASATPAACSGQVLAQDPADSPESAFLGAPIQTVPDQAAAANPITYIATAKTLPVFLVAHGDSDCQVPNQQSQILHKALRAAGATSTFNVIQGAGHDEAIIDSQTPSALEMLRSVFGK